MSLTDGEKKKLRQEIENILTEDRLKTIFLEYEEIFGGNFYNQITGNDYRTRIVYVIKELNNRQLINKFIEIVREEYLNFASNLVIPSPSEQIEEVNSKENGQSSISSEGKSTLKKLENIRLTDPQRKNLIEIIKNVFTENEIKTICRDNKEALGGNLYNKIAGETFDDRLSYFVNFLIQKNRLIFFFDVCLNDEVNLNSELYNFYKNYIKKEYKQIFDNCNFNELIYILREIRQKEEKILQELYKNYGHRLNDKKNIHTNITNECSIILMLSKTILEQSKKDDFICDKIEPIESYVLKDFVDYFLNKIVSAEKIDDSLKGRLEEWIVKNCQQNEIAETRCKTLNNIINHLFIIIEPKYNKKFFIQGEFAQFDNDNKIKTTAKKLVLSDNHTYAQGCLEKDIPVVIEELIRKMYAYIKDCNLQLSEKPIIELFLPVKLFSKKIHTVKVNISPPEKQAIGVIHPVTIRSLERYSNSHKENGFNYIWGLQWRKLKDQLISECNDNKQDFFDRNKHLVISDSERNFFDECMSIKIICSLPSRSKKRKDFFYRIIRTGAPLCLWTTYKNINNIDILQKLKEVLNIKYLNNLYGYDFYQYIHNIRKPDRDNSQYDFGCELSVLFDHDKLPDLFMPLTSPNSIN